MNRTRYGLAIFMLVGGVSGGCSNTRNGSGSGDAGSDATSSGSSEDGGSDGGGAASLNGAVFNDAGIPLCGSTPCDLKSNTCCVTQTATGTCIPHGQTCPASTAAFSCLQASDCTVAGQVCCGSITQETSCQTIVSTCPPAGGMSAQVCQTTAECKNGMQCTPQTCSMFPFATAGGVVQVVAHLTLCGVQSMCTPDPCSPGCTNQACVSGACTGVCTPGATQCSGNGVQTCDSTGNWGSAVACSFGCLSGSCNVCSPGATQCSGNGVHTCGSTGTWGIAVTCVNSACVSGACTGVCVPNTAQCSGSGVQTCDATGNWGVAAACSLGCLSGSCAVCTPGATQCSGNGVQTCAASGQWGTAVACTNQACVSGGCTGVCTPGTTQCASNGVQTCSASGQWGTAWPCTTGTCNVGACTGSTTGATSCQIAGAGITNCGASSESCCTSIEVPSGTYYRTYTNSGSGPTGEADPATVSGFRLDKYLVTVGRFRQFVNAVLPTDGGAVWTPPAASGKHTHLNGGSGLNATGGGYEPGWVTSDNSNIAPTNTNLACQPPFNTWTNTAGSQENLPINCVTWDEAYAFCIWDGGFLPSEAEWEYAAAGGSQQREYPWGTTAPGTANQYAIYGCYYPSGSSCTGVTNIAPVGFAASGAGPWGQLDLAGNMLEWNLDGYASRYVNPCADCANLTAASNRVFRGDHFNGAASFLLPPNRNGSAPTNRYFFGLRCSRNP